MRPTLLGKPALEHASALRAELAHRAGLQPFKQVRLVREERALNLVLEEARPQRINEGCRGRAPVIANLSQEARIRVRVPVPRFPAKSVAPRRPRWRHHIRWMPHASQEVCDRLTHRYDGIGGLHESGLMFEVPCPADRWIPQEPRRLDLEARRAVFLHKPLAQPSHVLIVE